jgi:hypothetical protein
MHPTPPTGARWRRRTFRVVVVGLASVSLVATAVWLVLPDEQHAAALRPSSPTAGPSPVAPRPAAAARRALQGVSAGDSAAAVRKYEQWMAKVKPGFQVDGILGSVGDASWTDYERSTDRSISKDPKNNRWGSIDRPVFWSVPLIPRGATLTQAAGPTSGAKADSRYTKHWTKVAKTILSHRPQDSTIIVRVATGFSAKPTVCAEAFREFVRAFRAVPGGQKFRFDWNVTIGDGGINPEPAYPTGTDSSGRDYVDMISMDFAWSPKPKGPDPQDGRQAWASMVSRRYGLGWHQQFAAKMGKPTAFPEWGVTSQGKSTDVYLTSARQWFTGHDVVYEAYTYAGKADDTYRKIFAV